MFTQDGAQPCRCSWSRPASCSRGATTEPAGSTDDRHHDHARRRRPRPPTHHDRHDDRPPVAMTVCHAQRIRHTRRPTQRRQAHVGQRDVRPARSASSATSRRPRAPRAWACSPRPRRSSCSSTRPACTSRSPRSASGSTRRRSTASATSTWSCLVIDAHQAVRQRRPVGGRPPRPANVDRHRQQDRRGQARTRCIGQLSAASVAGRVRVLPGVGQDRRGHPRADRAPHGADARGPAVLPRRHGQRSARGAVGRRARPRAAAGRHARRAAVQHRHARDRVGVAAHPRARSSSSARARRAWSSARAARC